MLVPSFLRKNKEYLTLFLLQRDVAISTDLHDFPRSEEKQGKWREQAYYLYSLSMPKAEALCLHTPSLFFY